MFILIGIVGAVILAVAAAWIFYVAGNRGRAQETADRATLEREQHTSPTEPARADGRGDL